MSSTQVRVLLVDDRPENLMSLEAMLSSDGYELIKAGSGGDALRYLLVNDCAIILLDVQMPNMDGFETADLIKADPKLKDIPIIFLTALNHDQRYVTRGYRSGAVDYMSKPIVPEILRAKIAVFAQLHRSKQKILEQAQMLQEHERKERERALAELELKAVRREQALDRRYRDLVDGIKNAVVWVAEPRSLVFTFVSGGDKPFLGGGERLEVASPVLDQLVHPDDREMFKSGLDRLGVGELTTFEHRMQRRHDDEVWLSTTVRLEHKLEGEGLELRGLSVDVSEAKSEEKTLRLVADVSEKLGASLDVQQIVDCLATLAVPAIGDGCTVTLFRTGDEDDLLGAEGASKVAWARPEQQAAFDALRAHPAHAGSVLNGRDEARAVADLGRPEGVARLPDDAEYRRLVAALGLQSFVATPLAVRGRTVGFMDLWSCSTARSLDARAVLLAADLARRAGQALDNAVLYRATQEAVAHRDEFLSVASHELRTPLAPLKLNVQSCLSSLKNKQGVPVEATPPLVKKLELADRQVDRLHLLVDTLLDVSRIRTGRLELQRERVDLGHLVSDVTQRFQPELTRKQVVVDLRVEPVVGFWDKNRIDQVVTNLLTNAIKYGEGKPIEIRVSMRGNGQSAHGAELMVADRGIGIAADDTQRIFGRFERAASSNNYGGLGLGLYISQQIVQAHGGAIRVETAPGEGARFFVELPVAPAATVTASGAS